MKARRRKIRVFSELSPRTIRLATAVVLAIAVVAALCISIFSCLNIQRRYANVRTQLQEAVYQNLYLLSRRSDELSLAGTDISGTVLPAMKEHYAVAVALNDALTEAFGQKRAVLDPDDAAAIRAGLDAYSAALRGGMSTDQPRAQLTDSVAQVAAQVDAHYDGNLIPTE